MNVPPISLLLALFASTLALEAGAAVGDLYVTTNTASTTNGSVVRITSSGSVSTLAGGLSRPYGLAIDSFGNVYTSDIAGGTITKIDIGGVATPFASGLSGPRGMAFDLLGNLIVATGGTLTKITPDGTKSTFDSGFATIWDVTFDSDGTMYADDLGTRRIYKYTPQGQRSILATASGMPTVYGLALNAADDLIVTQGPSGEVLRVSPDGSQASFTSSGVGFQPVGIDINSAGEVFIGSFGSIFKYSADGSSQSPFASGLQSTGMLAFQVPEPSIAGLLLLGISGLGRRRARRDLGRAQV